MKYPWVSQSPDGNIKAEEPQMTSHGINYVTIEPRTGAVVASNVAEETEAYRRLATAARSACRRPDGRGNAMITYYLEGTRVLDKNGVLVGEVISQHGSTVGIKFLDSSWQEVKKQLAAGGQFSISVELPKDGMEFVNADKFEQKQD